MYTLFPQQKKHEKFTYCRGAPPQIDSDPKGWFELIDNDKDGFITREQILISIFATLRPTKTQRLLLRKKVRDKWHKYDKDQRMKLTKKEFMESGIVRFITHVIDEFNETCEGHFNKPVAAKRRRASIGVPPSLMKESQKWFEHYDTDYSTTLSQVEVFHGLFEALQPQDENEKNVIIEVIENTWSIFDIDYDGSITKWEFLRKGGFADYLIVVEREWKKSPSNRKTSYLLNINVMGKRRHSYVKPPLLSDDPEKWFEHFDIDFSGVLSQKEIIIGLIVTYNATTSEPRKMIRHHVASNWDSFDKKCDEVLHKDEFLRPGGFAECLIEYEENNYQNPFECIEGEDEIEDYEEREKVDSRAEVQVNIPQGFKSGDLLKIASPVAHELVLLMIPAKVKWGGGYGKPYFFTVTF